MRQTISETITFATYWIGNVFGGNEFSSPVSQGGCAAAVAAVVVRAHWSDELV